MGHASDDRIVTTAGAAISAFDSGVVETTSAVFQDDLSVTLPADTNTYTVMWGAKLKQAVGGKVGIVRLFDKTATAVLDGPGLVAGSTGPEETNTVSGAVSLTQAGATREVMIQWRDAPPGGDAQRLSDRWIVVTRAP